MSEEPASPVVPVVDAYSLLSKPTLDLTDAEAKLVIADLRERRLKFQSTAKPDNPKAERAKAAKPQSKAAKTAAERKAATDAIFANLQLDVGKLLP